ncbi:hypothetical protein EsH8_X_000079 [Colletotrichum jinshuiense]
MAYQHNGTFPYSFIDPAQREIRLVRFTDLGDENDQSKTFRLELQHASLNSDISFAALSYVWGNPDDKVTVKINGEPMHVTINLYSALQQLRQNEVKSWIWIDAICIAQLDLKEKICQVNIMKDIFSRADLVYLWLGPGCQESNMVMDVVSRVGARLHAAGALEFDRDWSKVSKAREYVEICLDSDSNHIEDASELELALYDLVCDFLSHGSSTMRDGVENVLKRDYWHRIWIVQEVVLARQSLVMVGTRKASLEVFDATFTALWWCKGIVPPDDPRRKHHFSGLSGTLYPPQAIIVRSRHQAGCHFDMANFLWVYGIAPHRPHYTATDPRDLMFGLLGLVADESKHELRADYTLSFVEVFTRVTRFLLRSASEDAYFRLDCVNPGDPNGPLPTWVPDWRDIGKYGVKPYPIKYNSHYKAYGGKSGQIEAIPGVLENNLGCLHRRGCLVDEIVEVMPPPDWIQENPYIPAYLKSNEKWFSSIAAFMKLGKDSGAAEDYIWRTVTRDNFLRYAHIWVPKRGAEPEGNVTEGLAWVCRRIMRLETIDTTTLTAEQDGFIRIALKRRYGELASNGPLEAGKIKLFAEDLRYTLGSINRHRTLFKTAKGMLGLGHVGVEVGDIVTLMWGVPSPIVLRRRNEGAYYFRGDAYVDGIMYGEYLINEPREECFDIH